MTQGTDDLYASHLLAHLLELIRAAGKTIERGDAENGKGVRTRSGLSVSRARITVRKYTYSCRRPRTLANGNEISASVKWS